MGGEGGTSSCDGTGEGLQRLKRGALKNGFVGGTGNDGGDGNSRASEGMQTYKRRKHKRLSSESKSQGDGRCSAEAASKLEDQAIQDSLDHLPGNHASLNGSNSVSRRQWRKFVLELMYQSLSDDDGGLLGCIHDALMVTAKELDIFHEDRHKYSSKTGWMPNGTHHETKEHVGIISNGALNQSCHRTATAMCQHVFFSIIFSEKFTSLCKLLFENFQEMKVDNLFSLSLINRRMKEGAYEHSPMLFSADIEQLWIKLRGIGTELINLANGLSEVSRIYYNEQVGGSVYCPFEDGKHEFCSHEPNSHGKPEQVDACDLYRVCTCRHCGDKADGRDCLVCDSCEEMYHVSCIEPAVKEIPQKNWYCASCTASGLGSPHENCFVCEKLNPGLANRAGDEISPRNEKTVNEFEENSNYSVDDGGYQMPEGNKQCHSCKMCGTEVGNGERIKRCDHAFCPNKYYHVRCLTIKQIKSYGPCWYCPSCLCQVCLTDRDDNKICLCDGCDDAYHIYCMDPPHTCIPRGKWFCRQCDVKIQEIRRVRKVYEKYENKLKRKRLEEKWKILEKEVNEKGDGESDRGRERMNMLLHAALNYEAANQVKS